MSQICPYCRESIADSDLHLCPACQTPHHEDCWRENNGCTVFGCKCAPADEPKVSIGAQDSLAVTPQGPLASLPPNAMFHLARNGQRFGPYSFPDLQKYVNEGRVAPTDLMWAEGMPQWITVTAGLGLQAVPQPGFSPPLQGGVYPVSAAAMHAGAVKPPSYMVSAILVTLFCCIPFGIVSIIYASQVDSKFNLGDYAGAQSASDKAKNWYHAALATGLVIIGLSIARNMSKVAN